jgi:serine/threonine protein kinase
MIICSGFVLKTRIVNNNCCVVFVLLFFVFVEKFRRVQLVTPMITKALALNAIWHQNNFNINESGTQCVVLVVFAICFFCCREIYRNCYCQHRFAVDLWAAGVVAYELVTHRRPFCAADELSARKHEVFVFEKQFSFVFVD